MKTLYAIPNFECNLSCDYCELKDRYVKYNEKKFLSALDNFDGQIILFGGEPLLDKSRLFKILETNKIDSISTNLLLLDKKTAEKLAEIGIATTWTPNRFTEKQLDKWIDNLEALRQHNIDTKLLITLSEDTVSTKPRMVYEFLKRLEKSSITSVLFEMLLDKSRPKEYYELCDLWLCEMREYFKDLPYINEIEEQIKNGWYFDCSQVFTLYPNGEIKKFCPQFSSYTLNTDCLKCERNTTCRPCMLQNRCVYPKKFGNLVLEEHKKGTSNYKK